MKLKEWGILLPLIGIAILTTNTWGFGKGIAESLPGIIALLVIAFIAAVLTKLIPLKLPVVMYCSILGLLISLPVSPLHEFMATHTSKVGFAAPLTLVGALAGISLGKDYRKFLSQGWKMLIIGVVVLTGTFIGSAVVAQIVLKATNAI